MGLSRILVVEDERHASRLVQVNLEKQGWEVETAICGADALALASKVFDFVVVDPTLPDMTLAAFRQFLSNDPRTAALEVKVIEKSATSTQ